MDDHAATEIDPHDFEVLPAWEISTYENNVYGESSWKDNGVLHQGDQFVDLDGQVAHYPGYESDSRHNFDSISRRHQSFLGCECTARPWRNAFTGDPKDRKRQTIILFGTCAYCIKRLVGERPVWRSATPFLKIRGRPFEKLHKEDVKKQDTFKLWLRMEKIKCSRLIKKQKLL
jgi:hypothetical protein